MTTNTSSLTISEAESLGAEAGKSNYLNGARWGYSSTPQWDAPRVEAWKRGYQLGWSATHMQLMDDVLPCAECGTALPLKKDKAADVNAQVGLMSNGAFHIHKNGHFIELSSAEFAEMLRYMERHIYTAGVNRTQEHA